MCRVEMQVGRLIARCKQQLRRCRSAAISAQSFGALIVSRERPSGHVTPAMAKKAAGIAGCNRLQLNGTAIVWYPAPMWLYPGSFESYAR